MHKLIIAALLAAGVTAAPSAQATSFVSAKYLLELCQSKEPGGSELCSGYITGVIDANDDYSQAFETQLFCAPAKTSVGTMRDVAIAFLKAHPEKGEFTASSVVMLGLIEKYPCPKQK